MFPLEMKQSCLPAFAFATGAGAPGTSMELLDWVSTRSHTQVLEIPRLAALVCSAGFQHLLLRTEISPTWKILLPQGFSTAFLTGCMLAVRWHKRQPAEKQQGIIQGCCNVQKSIHSCTRRCCTNL